MTNRDDARIGPMRRPGRLPTVRRLVLLLLLGWAGCAAFDRGQTLVPTRYQVRTGPFIVFSNSPMADDPPGGPLPPGAGARHRTATWASGPRPSEDPVEIYVLDDRQDFDHFLKFYYPELPPRRAFFLAKGSQRRRLHLHQPRLEEDLRHEATHALLRGAFGDLPLWLDEGLAEYFETDLSRPGRRARPPRADRRRPARSMVPEPGAAGVAHGHPPDDPARLPGSLGLGPPLPQRARARQVDPDGLPGPGRPGGDQGPAAAPPGGGADRRRRPAGPPERPAIRPGRLGPAARAGLGPIPGPAGRAGGPAPGGPAARAIPPAGGLAGALTSFRGG